MSGSGVRASSSDFNLLDFFLMIFIFVFQYDYSCGTFSPDGRIFQVEYAHKAVESSG